MPRADLADTCVLMLFVKPLEVVGVGMSSKYKILAKIKCMQGHAVQQ